MPYEVIIVRADITHEFVCKDMSKGILPESLSFEACQDPDGSTYDKLYVVAPGDIINYREVKTKE